jgi:hypothetical protein
MFIAVLCCALPTLPADDKPNSKTKLRELLKERLTHIEMAQQEEIMNREVGLGTAAHFIELCRAKLETELELAETKAERLKILDAAVQSMKASEKGVRDMKVEGLATTSQLWKLTDWRIETEIMLEKAKAAR